MVNSFYHCIAALYEEMTADKQDTSVVVLKAFDFPYVDGKQLMNHQSLLFQKSPSKKLILK